MSNLVTVKKLPNTGRNRVNTIKSDWYYIPIIGDKEYRYISETEEVAFLMGIGIKYLGENTQFAKFACRMLGIKRVWTDS